MSNKLHMYQELVDKIDSLKEERKELQLRLHELELVIERYKNLNTKYEKINVQMLRNFIVNERLSDEQREKLENILIISE